MLITTQNQHWPPGQALEVPVLDLGVAADFLVNRTGDADRAAAGELAAELGGLPLALEQAAAYMQATGTTLVRYLPMFRDRQADLLASGEAAGHPADVAATLGLALSRLAEEDRSAGGLVRLLAFLAPEPVPLALLLTGEQSAGLIGPEVADVVGPLLGDLVAVGAAIIALRRYSLIAPAGDGLVLVHRLVRAMTRAQLTADLAAQWEQAAAALVEMAVRTDPKLPAAWPVAAVLLPHARTVLDLTSEGLWQITESVGYSGRYTAARDLFRLIANAHTKSEAYGPEHPRTLTARHDLAYWTGEAGDAAGARDQFAALLPIRERVLGPEHPATLTARHNLAYWTGQAGDAAGARDRFAALLPIRERLQGPEHRATLNARHGLAYWTGEAGDAAGARDQLARRMCRQPADQAQPPREQPHRQNPSVRDQPLVVPGEFQPARPRSTNARKGCTRLSSIAILDKSHSGWSGAPHPRSSRFTREVPHPAHSPISVKDGGWPGMTVTVTARAALARPAGSTLIIGIVPVPSKGPVARASNTCDRPVSVGH